MLPQWVVASDCSGIVAYPPTPCLLPLLCCPPNLSLQCQSYRFHHVDLVVLTLRSSVYMHHSHAKFPTQQPILYPTFFVDLLPPGDHVTTILPNLPTYHVLDFPLLYNASRKRVNGINGRIHELSSELDSRILNSKLVDTPQHILDGLARKTFVGALSGLWDMTLASNLVSESVKARRLVICFDAADAAFTSIDREFFHDTLSGRWDGVLQSLKIGNYLRSRGNNRDRETNLYTQSTVAGVIANVRERDNHWFALVKDQLNISGDVLQEYVTHGDSVLLANLIHITSKILRTFEGDHHSAYISSRVLRSVSQFDILHILPELQHGFCAVWNDVVKEAWKRGSDSIPIYILRHIRHLYIALHQGQTTYHARPDHRRHR